MVLETLIMLCVAVALVVVVTGALLETGLWVPKFVISRLSVPADVLRAADMTPPAFPIVRSASFSFMITRAVLMPTSPPQQIYSAIFFFFFFFFLWFGGSWRTSWRGAGGVIKLRFKIFFAWTVGSAGGRGKRLQYFSTASAPAVNRYATDFLPHAGHEGLCASYQLWDKKKPFYFLLSHVPSEKQKLFFVVTSRSQEQLVSSFFSFNEFRW